MPTQIDPSEAILNAYKRDVAKYRARIREMEAKIKELEEKVTDLERDAEEKQYGEDL